MFDYRAYLNSQYEFNCTCAVCSLPPAESEASDARLSAMSALHSELRSWGSGEINGTKAVDLIQNIWSLGEEEGYWSERGQLASDAAWVAAAHSE